MKNIDSINHVISERTGYKKEVVKSVNKFFWKEVKHKMTHLEDTTIFIKGFISFTISRYLLREQIIDLIRTIRSVKETTRFKEETKEKFIIKYYSYLRKLLYQRNEVAKIHYERDNRISETDSEGIEEYSDDSGRDSEQCEIST